LIIPRHNNDKVEKDMNGGSKIGLIAKVIKYQ
jgi:hypothetical protein